MSNDHDQHYVSTKVAFYNQDASAILVMQLQDSLYGLPGGHVDRGETPDQAIVRELQEELGLVVDASRLTRADFFRHENGKIVLAYTARLDSSTEFFPGDPDKEVGVWVSRDQLSTLAIPRVYIDFGLANWPTS